MEEANWCGLELRTSEFGSCGVEIDEIARIPASFPVSDLLSSFLGYQATLPCLPLGSTAL